MKIRKKCERKMHLLSLISLLFILTVIECKINNEIFQPNVYADKQIPISRLQSAAHRFSIQSTDQNLELSGQVYQSEQIINSSQIYNISKYKKSESCTYFKSILQMESLKGQNLDFVALDSLVSETNKQLYVIGTKQQFQDNRKFLRIYNYDFTHFSFQDQVTFQKTNLNQNIDYDIHLTEFNNVVLFSDGNNLWRLDQQIDKKKSSTSFNWAKIQGFNVGIAQWKAQQFFSVTTMFYQQKQLLLFLYSEKIVFYQFFESQQQVKKFIDIENKSQKPFQDVQIGQNSYHLYALTGNQMYFYDSKQLDKPIKHQLAGETCSRIYVYHSTIHVICEYEKRNFIGEYYYNSTSNVLILNRFYNDLQNYRILDYIQNYFLMIGQNDIIMTSQGVNRKVLLQMPKNAYSQRFISFGIERLHMLKQFDQKPYKRTLLAVGEDFVVLFKLKFYPAEVWCYFQRPSSSRQTNILVVRNTSKCELNQRQQPLKSICSNLKPVQVNFQHYEIEERVTSIFLIIVILLIFVLAFLCLGCVFRQNMNYNNLIRRVRDQINKIKPKSHQLRSI